MIEYPTFIGGYIIYGYMLDKMVGNTHFLSSFLLEWDDDFFCSKDMKYLRFPSRLRRKDGFIFRWIRCTLLMSSQADYGQKTIYP